MTRQNLDSIFEVLGSKTRRDILTNLSSEPMYFNQLSKKIGIGQQAVLRHMKTLHKTGFVAPYDEKSDLGAPDRKFYRLDSSFTLTISSSQDEFSIRYNDISPGTNKKASNLKNKVSGNNKDEALDMIFDNLVEIDNEIDSLEKRLHNLREMRQVLLHRTNQIGRSKFDRVGQKVLYQLVTQDHQSLKSMYDKVSESKVDVQVALDQINADLETGTISNRAGELIH